MKKILSVMLALLLMLSCCAFFAPRPAEASLESDLAAARKKLEEAEKRVAQLQKQIEEAKNDQKRQIEAKITMEEQVAALDEQMEAMETVLEELKQDLSEKEAALAEPVPRGGAACRRAFSGTERSECPYSIYGRYLVTLLMQL